MNSIQAEMSPTSEETASCMAMFLATWSVPSMVFKAILELNVIGIINNAGPTTQPSVAQIVAHLPTANPHAAVDLERMLRLLASFNVFICSQQVGPDGQPESVYGLGPLCKFFFKNNDEGSYAPYADFMHHDMVMDSLKYLKDSILDGEVYFKKTWPNTSYYEYLGRDNNFYKIAYNAMDHRSLIMQKKFLEIYKGFEGISSLVDVGGATGATLSMIINKYPFIKGINFDLPQTIKNAPQISGIEHVGGDMYVSIPKADAVFMKVLKDGLSTLHVPYSYGFAIILLTVLVKAATFPLSKKQVESAMSMRSLQPQIKAIQKRYAGDQERIQLETARLYKVAGINPLAGCLPTLATIPVWIGLYRALSNVANEGLLTEGFFWIPSLAGPTTIASRQNGSGISWLFPFVDGHPPLGWSDTAAYLVLPVLLVVSQYISVQIMQSSQPNDPNLKSSQALTKFLPLMIGYFALSVPSGLSLYWFTNNILSTLQQVYLQKMGGANNPLGPLSDDFFKEEQTVDSPSPKPNVLETKLTQTEEKSPSTGLRPGDRFKQLKEEEARRKRLRDEKKMKKEASAKIVESKMENEQENNSVGTANGHASNDGVAINGNVHDSSSGHQDTPELTSENGRPINGTDDGEKKEDSVDKKQEAVEVQNRLGFGDQSSGEEASNI